ncbi:MAG TPA: TadE/TadG family type IV pilus assembly protein [Acidisarcina sp.]
MHTPDLPSTAHRPSRTSPPRPGSPPARQPLRRAEQGQSLIEVALFLPIFTILVCYAVDFGYFFLAATTITSAARDAAQYAVEGPQSAAQAAVPTAGPGGTTGTVVNLAEAALGLPGGTTLTTVQVCSNGVAGSPAANNIAKCKTWGANAGLSYTPHVDPESPTFQLNRVDVVYTVTPPVPMPTAAMPTMVFHRTVEMRAMQ